MIEAIRHALGLCGEGHPSLLTGLSVIVVFIAGAVPFLKYKIKKACSKEECTCKNHEH